MKNYEKEDMKYMKMEEYEMDEGYKKMPGHQMPGHQMPGHQMPGHQMPHHPQNQMNYPQGPHCGCIPMPEPECKVIHKYHYEEYPVCVPVHTHVVNHIVRKPKYIPEYSCSEETTCEVQRSC